MYKWTAFPFIRLAICLASGILVQAHYPELWQTLHLGQFFLLIGGIITLSIIIRFPVLKGILLLSVTFLLGGLLGQYSDESASPDHYAKHERVDGFVGVITSDNTERDNHHRYEMELKLLNQGDSTFYTQGKIYFYVSKSSSPEAGFEYGDVLAVERGYFNVAPPKNPHEFNYKAYLRKLNIYSHAFVDVENITKVDHQPSSQLMAWAYKIRTKAKSQIADYIPEKRERAILTALLLGIKDYLDNDIQTAYAAAGAMHVLAVSGLHVGIVVLMLSALFMKWKDTRLGNIIFTVTSVLVIWSYALVTGFSPSVMRAAAMFTVIVISSGVSKRANIYNSLGIAAIVLIIYNPLIIYSVGFQLSFAAVLGIVILHPKLYHIFDFTSKIPDYLWSITCVSIAAQIATFPLSLLYFHQFPTYFLISNLIVIPSAVVMLGGGIAMLILGSIFAPIGIGIGFLLQWFVWLINETILLLQHLPYPIFDWLYFDALDTILVYGIILFLVLAFIRYSYEFVALTFVSALGLFFWLHLKSFERIDQKKIIFYEIDGLTAIDLIHGNKAQLLLDNPEMGGAEVVSYQIDPNRLANGLPKSSETWTFFGESELIKSNEHFDLLNWEGFEIAMIKDFAPYEIIDSLRADLIYFKSNKDVEYNYLSGNQVLLGTDFNFYENRKVTNKLTALNIDVHSLTQDGFWELDLTKQD